MTKFTLWGIYQYDTTLFENCIYPPNEDINLFIETLMQHSGELYPYHQQPDFLKQNIQNWFHRRYESFSRMFEALHSDYSPIENYDRNEEWTDTPDVTYARSGGHSNVSDVETNVSDSERSVAAYNTTGYSPESKVHDESHGKQTDTFTYNGEQSTETGTRKHKGRIHGNIGVTTNQQMIESELNLRKYDLLLQMVMEFEEEFLIQVY